MTDTLDDFLPESELDSVDEPIELGELPGTFVVSGLIRGIDYKRHCRRGYIFRNRREALIWCMRRYGKVWHVDNVPGWAWAFRVTIPREELQRDEKVPYHMGWGQFRPTGKKGN